MGFFSNLVNKITGGGAKLSLVADNPKLNENFKVEIKAIVADADLKIDKVYLYLKGVERTQVRNVDFPASGSSSAQKRDVHGEEETARTEFVVANAQTLNANQEYTWTYEVRLPSGALPTYNGRNAWHEWFLLAGLDAPGNDPDSGWIKIDVAK
jgi:hypothetical protein